jgi:hypothetical protein
MEDEREQTMRGQDSLRELTEDWRFGGSLIQDTSNRREAFNIMVSMPRGTDPSSVQWAARQFAKAELADHKYVMVLHDHQANPHVHISVRAESRYGRRLNPRKSDLHRWRETFAEKLRERGVDAEATRQATRGNRRSYDPLCRIKAREAGRLRAIRAGATSRSGARKSHAHAVDAWSHLGRALAASSLAADRDLAQSIERFVGGIIRDPADPHRDLSTQRSDRAPSPTHAQSR